MSKQSLQGQSFIVTRSKQQAISLIRQIEKLGGKALSFPTIEIENSPEHSSLHQSVQKLPHYDYAIFISANAARVALPLWPKISNFPKIIAIGPGTAKAIQQHHFQVDYIPSEFSSEGIMDLPILQKIENQNFVIFCGENSRPHLKNTLIQRGANVDESICYYRRLPNLQPLNIQDKDISCIITTSKEGLQNLFYFAKKSLIKINNIPILIISENMHHTLKKLQPNHPYFMAKNATDDAIIETLLKNFDTIKK